MGRSHISNSHFSNVLFYSDQPQSAEIQLQRKSHFYQQGFLIQASSIPRLDLCHLGSPFPFSQKFSEEFYIFFQFPNVYYIPHGKLCSWFGKEFLDSKLIVYTVLKASLDCLQFLWLSSNDLESASILVKF